MKEEILEILFKQKLNKGNNCLRYREIVDVPVPWLFQNLIKLGQSDPARESLLALNHWMQICFDDVHLVLTLLWNITSSTVEDWESVTITEEQTSYIK